VKYITSNEIKSMDLWNTIDASLCSRKVEHIVSCVIVLRNFDVLSDNFVIGGGDYANRY
jgi:hypothetical protein